MLSATKVTECEDTDWGSPRVTGRIGGSSRRGKQRGLRREVATATCSPLLSAAASVTFFFGTIHQSCRISTLSPSTSGCLSLSGVNAHVLNMLFGVTIYNIFRFAKHHRFPPHRCAFVRGTLWVTVPEALVLSVTSVHCFSKELLVSVGVGVAGGWPAKLFWPPFLPLGE